MAIYLLLIPVFCVRDSDPWGGDSRESCIAFLGSEAPFYEVGRERSEPDNP